MSKIAIVTAASRGMGAACAKKLAKEGYKLVLMSRSDDLYDLADELNARPFKGSVDSNVDLKNLISLTFEKYGRIDVLVNNTGHAAKGDLLSLDDNQWHQGFNLLLLNIIRTSRLVGPIMEKQEAGSIINISTFGAKEPSLRFPISSVMRAGLSSYTKLFAKEMASCNVRMNNILPGFINSYPADEETINEIPMLRQGSPEEVAELTAFLASNKASYITGQDILIDGGLVNAH
jgi:NAD(P)-dependent dehydrogenase (short-subunit alcohol dehydrogenase family)